MSDEGSASVHASAVMVGERAVLIRGASGAGKSRLAFDLIIAGRTGAIAETQLVADDRVRLHARDGHLMAEAVAELAGLIEIRGLGIRRCQYVAEAIVGLVVDLDATDGTRLPPPASLTATIKEIELPRIPVPPGYLALPMVLAALTTASATGHSGV